MKKKSLIKRIIATVLAITLVMVALPENVTLMVYASTYSLEQILNGSAGYVPVPIHAQLAETPNFDTKDAKLTFKITPVSAKNLANTSSIMASSAMPMPSSDTVEIPCPSKAGEQTGYGFTDDDNPWKLNISQEGIYTYSISYVAKEGIPFKSEIPTTLVIEARSVGGKMSLKYSNTSDVAQINKDSFNMTLGQTYNSTVIEGGKNKGATVEETADGKIKLTVGGTKPCELDAFDSAALKSKFSIDFTKSFELKGNVNVSILPDGSVLGFVPDGTPQTSTQVQKWWCSGVFGWNGSGLVTVPVNGKGVFLEFDAWGNTGNADDYLINVSSDGAGRHIVVMTTDANGIPVCSKASDIMCVTSNSAQKKLVNIAAGNWPNKNNSFKISYDKDSDILSFQVDPDVYYEYKNPKAVFGTDKAYFIMGANVRFGTYSGYRSYFDYYSNVTTLTFDNFCYTENDSSKVTNTFTMTGIPHVHNLSYSVNPDGDGIVATCNYVGHVGAKDTVVKLLTNSDTVFKNDILYPISLDNATAFNSLTGQNVKAADVTYYDENGGTVSPGPVYPGNYTAKLSLNIGGTNYVAEKSFTVTKGVRTGVSAPSMADCVYGSEPVVPTITGTETSDVISYFINTTDSNTGGTAFDFSNPQKLDVGTYYIYAEIDETDNFLKYTTDTATFSVTAKEASLEWENSSFEYDGESHKPDAKVSNPVTGDEGTLSVTVSGEQTDVGVYVASADSINSSNYSIPTEHTHSFSITPKELTEDMVTIDDSACKADGNINKPVITVKDGSRELTENDDYEIDTTAGTPSSDKYGTYTIKINGTGNYNGSVSMKWSVKDITAPAGEIKTVDKSVTQTLNKITFGLFFKNNQEVTITATDTESAVKSVEYYVSDEILSEEAVTALTDWTEYSDTIMLDSQRGYVIYARLTDNAGNWTIIGSDGMTIDSNAPVVLGVKDKESYCFKAEFSVTDDNLDKVLVDGEAKDPENGKYIIMGDDKAHTVEAVDKAGNITKAEINVYVAHIFGEYINDNNATTLTDATETRTCKSCGEKESRVLPGTKLMDNTKNSHLDKVPLEAGSIETDVVVADDTPVTTVGNLNSQVAQSLLLPDEVEEVKAGATETVFLEILNIDEKVDNTSKEMIQTVAESISPDVKTGMFMDISLFKKLSTESGAKRITDTNGKLLEITMTIPEKLRNVPEGYEREFYVVRIHDGEAQKIDSKYIADKNALVFTTGLFSTYSILYRDVRKGDPVPPSPEPEPEPAPMPGKLSPKTGDTGKMPMATLFGGMGMCLLSLFTIRKRK